MEFEQADGKQLHDLPREILVGIHPAYRISLGVLDVAEVVAHHRMPGDVVEQVAEVAEGVPPQHVLVVGESDVAIVQDHGVIAGHDENLAEGVYEASAELIRGVGLAGQPGRMVHPVVGVGLLGLGVEGHADGGAVGFRQGHLLVEPGGDADLSNADRLLLERSHRGGVQKVEGFGEGEAGRARISRQIRRRGEDVGAIDRVEIAADLTIGIANAVDVGIEAAVVQGLQDVVRRTAERPEMVRDLAGVQALDHRAALPAR